MSSPTVWCPSCGAEYVAGSRYCSDCRVELVHEPRAVAPMNYERQSTNEEDDAADLVEIGTWPRLQAQILRRRLETAGLSVMVEWDGPSADALGTVLVPETAAEFAAAVVNEIDVEDEVPDTSPSAYVERIEEHLSAIGALLDELRTRLDSSN